MGLTVGLAESRPGLRTFATMLFAVALAACGGAAGPAGPGTAAPRATFHEFEELTAPPVGHWQGTLTIHGVIDVDKTEDGSSGDPGGVYYETYTIHELVQTDVTDTYAITAVDHDATYGLGVADISGSAANAGTTDELVVHTTDKRNSGCTWTEEQGTETKGSWTETGKAAGELRLQSDGSYRIEIHPDTALPNGEQPDGPQLPHRNWKTLMNLTAGCQGEHWDQPSTEGPIVSWVSSWLGDADVNSVYSNIKGQLNASNPGSVIDGTSTWTFLNPALTMTITWHLEHDSPIILPHD